MDLFNTQNKKHTKSFVSAEALTKSYKDKYKNVQTCILGLNSQWTKDILKEKAFSSSAFSGMNLGWRKETSYLGWSYNIGMGASGVCVHFEKLISLGIKEFILVGLCGSLNSKFKAGDIVIIDKAIQGEGVSSHYDFSKSFVSSPTSLLYKKIKKSFNYPQVCCWTTEAPFRETHSEIEHYQRLGVSVVDMETSAVFSVAQYRKVEAVSILVVSDELYYDNWVSQFNNPKVKNSYNNILETISDRFSV